MSPYVVMGPATCRAYFCGIDSFRRKSLDPLQPVALELLDHLFAGDLCTRLAHHQQGSLIPFRQHPPPLFRFEPESQLRQWLVKMAREHFSPITMQGALVLPPMRVGMMEASAIRRPESPCTRNCASTTAMSSLPILQLPTGW